MIPPFPLRWPQHQPRLEVHDRVPGRFQVGFRRSVDDLHAAMQANGVARENYSLTTNLPARANGDPMGVGRGVQDAGVALWWYESGKMRVLACDQFILVEHNIRAVGLAIEHLRALRRYGITQIADRMLDTFALPAGSGVEETPGEVRTPPEPPREWMEHFRVSEVASRDVVKRMYQRAARQAHPDIGGGNQAMTTLNVMWDQAQAWFDWRDKFRPD